MKKHASKHDQFVERLISRYGAGDSCLVPVLPEDWQRCKDNLNESGFLGAIITLNGFWWLLLLFYSAKWHFWHPVIIPTIAEILLSIFIYKKFIKWRRDKSRYPEWALKRFKAERQEESRKVLKGVGFGCLGIIFISLAVSIVNKFESSDIWLVHKKNRTAIIRNVSIQTEHDPMIYMNDGTVWKAEESPENLDMTSGDEIRYVYIYIPPIPPGFKIINPSCELKDVTTGYSVVGKRVSAPFRHSSCPAK